MNDQKLVLEKIREQMAWPINTFRPRPDNPALFDQQASFVRSRAKINVARGGNGSGKTQCAAFKVANFLLRDQPPPRPDTPFWVVSNTLTQVADICWKEKLHSLLPSDTIDWSRCNNWFNRTLNRPRTICLKPWANGNNWMIEFISLDQGRDSRQGYSIGGCWYSEQFPFEHFIEVIARTRDYYYDGSIVVEFTPLDPDLSMEFESIEAKSPEDWAFFRMNTSLNTAVPENWKKSLFAMCSEDERATRETGEYMGFDGLIFKHFNPAIHVADFTVPPGCRHLRGIDWGDSLEHPFVCLWGAKDGAGHWYIYDEYVDPHGLRIVERAKEIKGRYPWPSDMLHGVAYADPSRPGNINEYACLGIPMASAMNSVDKGIERLRYRFRDSNGKSTILIHPRCKRLIAGLKRYRWLKSSKSGMNPQAARMAPLKRDDDEVDALRYMIATDDIRPTKPVEFRDASIDAIELAQRHRVPLVASQNRVPLVRSGTPWPRLSRN